MAAWDRAFASIVLLCLLGCEEGFADASSDNEDNVAFFKPASQSSTYVARGFPAEATRAVDGNMATDMAARSCTHTNSEVDPWWMVDLEEVMGVSRVNITNRGDCCGDRLHDFSVRVSNESSPAADSQQCSFYSGAVGLGETQTVECAPTAVYGRYLYIQIQTGNSEILTLCEVQVETVKPHPNLRQYTYDGIRVEVSEEAYFLNMALNELKPKSYMPPEKPVHVNVLPNSITIVSEDPESRYLKINIDMHYVWYHPLLTWNPRNYSMRMNFPMRKLDLLWEPSIFPVDYDDNSAPNPQRLRDSRLSYNGMVTTRFDSLVTTACVKDLENFPYDTNYCTLFVKSLYYNSDEVQLFYGGDTMDLVEVVPMTNLNSQYEVTHKSINISDVADDLGVMSSCFKYTIALTRKPTYHAHAFILSAFFFMFLTPFVFIVPSKSGEKITLGSIILLAVVMLLAMVDESLPKGHMNVPIIVRYYAAIAVIDVLVIIITALVSNMTRGGQKRSRIPDLARTMLIDFLGRYLLIDATTSDVDQKVVYDVDPAENSESQTDPAEQSSASSPAQSSSPTFVTSDSADEILKCARSLAERDKRLAGEAEIETEWTLLTTVIDRALFVIFMFIVILCNISMLS